MNPTIPPEIFAALLGQMASPPTDPMEPAMPGYANDPNTLFPQPDMGSLNSARDVYTGLLGNAPQARPMPAPTPPAFRTQDAVLGLGIPALLALLGGSKGAKAIPEYLQGYLGGKMQKAGQDTQVAQQNVQYQNQNDQQNWMDALNVAKARLGFAEQDYNNAERNRDQEIARNDQNQYRKDQMTDRRIGSAVNAYNNAKSIGSMVAAAAQWRKAEEGSGVSTAPTDEQIQSDWGMKSANARNQVYDNWQNVLSQAKKGNYGMIAESELPRLRALKKQMEGELGLYGITDAILQDPETETTLEAKYKDALIKSAEGNLKARLNESQQRIMESKARIQRAKERIAMEGSRLEVGQFNAHTARMNYELRKEQKAFNGKAQGEIDKISAQIAGLKARQKDPNTSILKRRELENSIQGLIGKREFWKGQMESAIPADDKGQPVDNGVYSTKSGKKFSFDTSK